MFSKRYDLIIVTGCSLSSGMEMIDHLLPKFNTAKERGHSITRWYKNNFDTTGKDNLHVLNASRKEWQHKEKQEGSWPAQLRQQTGIPVVNLAEIGSSLPRILLDYSQHLKNNSYKLAKKILVIHQLPESGRQYMRFSKLHGRVNVLPQELDDNFGFDIQESRAEIERVKKKFKHFITRDGFIKNQYSRILKRIQSVSYGHNIDDLYIFQTGNDVPEEFNGKIVMNDFSVFWSGHKRGICGHPVDPAYNRKMCEFIIPYLS
jgi:hypothetical protein